MRGISKNRTRNGCVSLPVAYIKKLTDAKWKLVQKQNVTYNLDLSFFIF